MDSLNKRDEVMRLSGDDVAVLQNELSGFKDIIGDLTKAVSGLQIGFAELTRDVKNGFDRSEERTNVLFSSKNPNCVTEAARVTAIDTRLIAVEKILEENAKDKKTNYKWLWQLLAGSVIGAAAAIIVTRIIGELLCKV